jgi:hypothetical protein
MYRHSNRHPSIEVSVNTKKGLDAPKKQLFAGIGLAVVLTLPLRPIHFSVTAC